MSVDPLPDPVRASSQVIVAVGTDHHPFDRLVTWVDQWAAGHPEVSVLVQRGTSAAPGSCSSTELVPHPELCERFAMAAVAISHGGPSTVMDARLAGRLPIVVARDPALGEHVDDHQQRFAQHLVRHQLALVVDEREELHALLDRALVAPDEFSVPGHRSALVGVAEFARQLDGLLGTETPLVPNSPAGMFTSAGEPVEGAMSDATTTQEQVR